MKLPKNPFQRKVKNTEDINNNIEAESPESINTYSDINTGNPDSESESSESKNTDTKITDTEDIEAIIKKLLNRVKPSLVSFFFLIIAEFFKVPRIISIPICVVINYFGYFVIIPKANEVIVIERLGVTREKLLERQMHTSITSSTDSSKNPFRRLIFMLPFIDRIINTVSLAHTHYDMPPYEAKTNGGTKVWFNSYALIEVTNPSHFTYRIKNVESLIHESTKTQIIDLAADMKLEEIRKNIGEMNKTLAKNISTFINADYYGFNLVNIVLQSVKFPEDIEDAMSKKEKEKMMGEALWEKTRKEGEALREKAEQELKVAETNARRDVIAAEGYAKSTELRTIADAKRKKALLQPYVDAGVADVYAKGEALKNLPDNSTLFYGGGGISHDTAYMADILKKHSADKMSASTDHASTNTSAETTSTETEEE